MSYTLNFIFAFLIILLKFNKIVYSETIVIQPVDICVYLLPNGSRIDLNAISLTNGQPRFNDIKFKNKDSFSFNPCWDFKKGKKECFKGVGVCLNDSINVGENAGSTLLYDTDSQNISLIYLKGINKISNITLQCQTNVTVEDEFTVQGPQSGQYLMNLRSYCACANTCYGMKRQPGLSTGSILIILLFVAICVYFFGGMLYMRFARGATGKETIPNYDFWLDFPLLVRDGLLFAIYQKKPTDYSSYEAI